MSISKYQRYSNSKEDKWKSFGTKRTRKCIAETPVRVRRDRECNVQLLFVSRHQSLRSARNNAWRLICKKDKTSVRAMENKGTVIVSLGGTDAAGERMKARVIIKISRRKQTSAAAWWSCNDQRGRSSMQPVIVVTYQSRDVNYFIYSILLIAATAIMLPRYGERV